MGSTTIYINFGKAVKHFRLQKGISQEKLAELAEMHRTYISDIERGTRNVSLLNILKIAHSLGISASQLLHKMEEFD